MAKAWWGRVAEQCRGALWCFMGRQFWQNKRDGAIYAVEVDEGGHVIGSTGPVYAAEERGVELDYTDEDNELLIAYDNEWLEAHRNEFVKYGDEDKVA